MQEVLDIGGHLALLKGEDTAQDHYAQRLVSSVHKVSRRIGAMTDPATARTLRQWSDRFHALDTPAARDVVSTPFFTYYWLQLLNGCTRGDRDFLRAWAHHLGRFVLLPHLRQESEAIVTLRLPEPTAELWLPGAPVHYLTNKPVHTVQVGPDGDGEIRSGTLHLPRAYLCEEGAAELGGVRRVAHHVITGTSIEVCADDPWIHRHLTAMNSKPPVQGYPAADLGPLQPDGDQLKNIDAAYRLIADVWPEAIPEITAHVRLVVPYRSAFHSSFTEACLMGAVFLSEAMWPFSSTIYTAEHLLHEAAHLRLTLIEELDPLLMGSDVEFLSPVRKDPRPLSAMLQTVFAFARIAAFHRIAHAATGSPEHLARQVESAGLLRQALNAVEAEPAVVRTSAGEKLWADMRAEADAA